MPNIGREELIQKMIDLSNEMGTKKIPRHEFLRRAKLSERTIQQWFGTYNELILAAGLEPTITGFSGKVISDDEMLEEIIRVLRMEDSKLTTIFFEQNAAISLSAVQRRFGGWINALRLIKDRLDLVSDSSLIEKVNEYVDFESNNKVKSSEDSLKKSGESEIEEINDTYHGLLLESTNVYGDFINFRGLLHAPVNEQGVVFLFGMICKEIGYVVEIIRQGFPDCEAKRRIKNMPGKWQKVRIEFEFQAKSFKSHGHDPNECDLIICWENNWKECPLEVIELRSVLDALAKDSD